MVRTQLQGDTILRDGKRVIRLEHNNVCIICLSILTDDACEQVHLISTNSDWIVVRRATIIGKLMSAPASE